MKVDVVEPESVQAMVDVTVKEFGKIDYSVNSAGVSAMDPPPLFFESGMLGMMRGNDR